MVSIDLQIWDSYILAADPVIASAPFLAPFPEAGSLPQGELNWRTELPRDHRRSLPLTAEQC